MLTQVNCTLKNRCNDSFKTSRIRKKTNKKENMLTKIEICFVAKAELFISLTE